jgi:hypothetical protein
VQPQTLFARHPERIMIMPLSSAAARLVSYVLIVLLACACLGAGAKAQEKILNYHSIIVLQKTGAMTVTENIRIQAEGQKSTMAYIAIFHCHFWIRPEKPISLASSSCRSNAMAKTNPT